MKNIKYLLIGTLFGIFLYKSEVISWFRIQEMFRFQSFHMYGIIGTAVLIGMFSILIIKKLGLTAMDGEAIAIPEKQFSKGQIIGGFIFGLGWALTGACPGPLYSHLGAGSTVMAIALLSAIAGTWVYGYFRPRLPH